MQEEPRGPKPSIYDESFTIKDVRAAFERDRYATETLEPEIVEATPGHAVVRMRIRDVHRNALGAVMGGAIYTLADFALAIATNVGQAPTVTVSSTAEYLSGAKGTWLTATCDADKTGRTLVFATCDVYDDLGVHVARVASSCLRVQR